MNMEKPLKLVSEAKSVAGHTARSPREKHPFLEDVAVSPSGGKSLATIGAGRKIMVVDDNPVVLKAFELKLRANGFEVVTISNAANVVGVAEKAAAELIILDINFPSTGGLDWSGYTIMQWLRRFPALTGIPVILISGEDAKNHKAKSLAEGAVAFFEKPVSYPELLSAALRALGIQE